MDNTTRLKDLKDAIDKSSEVNFALSITFLLFLFYILVNVAATTDLMLLMPDSGFNIPLLNLQLPLLAFYILASPLVFLFHYNLLYHLDNHALKLLEWQNLRQRIDNESISSIITPNNPYTIKLWGRIIFTIQPKTDSTTILEKPQRENYHLHPFLFNSLLLDEEELIQRIKRLGLVFITIFSLYLIPIITLNYILNRFSDYHSFWISSLHLLIALLDAIILVTHSVNVRQLLVLRRINNDLENSKYPKNKPRKHSLLYLVLIILVMFVSQIVITKVNYDLSELDLREQKLIKSEPEREIIQAYIKQDSIITEADIRAKFTQGIDIRGRDFRKANFSMANLTNADIRNCDFESTDFSNAIFINVKGGWGTNFNKSRFFKTNLTGSDLNGAIFIEAFFSNAILKDVNLENANLTGADLSNANLTGADLSNANLTGADLSGANLTGANLRKAILFGVKIDKHYWIKLKGANLTLIKIAGTELNGIDLNGSILDSLTLSRFNLRLPKSNSFIEILANPITPLDTESLLFLHKEDRTVFQNSINEISKIIKDKQEKNYIIDSLKKDLEGYLKGKSFFKSNYLKLQKTTTKKFLSERRKISLESPYIAKNMLLILNQYSGTEIFMPDISFNDMLNTKLESELEKIIKSEINIELGKFEKLFLPFVKDLYSYLTKEKPAYWQKVKALMTKEDLKRLKKIIFQN
jgi:uncharacterized protein YjbI with pentapeptide repeats